MLEYSLLISRLNWLLRETNLEYFKIKQNIIIALNFFFISNQTEFRLIFSHQPSDEMFTEILFLLKMFLKLKF